MEYFDTYGMLGRILGVGGDPAATPDRFSQVKHDLAVVRFTLDDT